MRMRKMLWMGMGAAAAYLFDPERGHDRRMQLKSQAEERFGQKLGGNKQQDSYRASPPMPPPPPNGMGEPEATLIVVETETARAY